ncbi:Elicitin [Phytophthora palmivora]|uniref:Elicitin n=1 Tax=Phytophthora palmivora TaxID=4796 RepID=A0A2P4X2M8_9STRA|nr:Elicitin [Phytophthora palmivora]
MKSFAVAFAAVVSTVSAATSGSYADCSSTVLSALLTDQYIDQCATDSGYVFTAASIPDQDTIDKMCASTACQNLLADVTAMGLSECVIPVGDNILLLADLVDYVPEHCPASSTSSSTGSTSDYDHFVCEFGFDSDGHDSHTGSYHLIIDFDHDDDDDGHCMKLFFIGTVASALVQSVTADVCAIATLAKVLTNQYIDQCTTDSDYVFTSGVQPTPEEVSDMCASDSCHSLLADVEAMNLTECTLPIGSGIYLFADLIDYVSDQCAADTPEPATTPAPTPVPTTATPTPTTATPAPTTAVASCTSAQLRYLLTSTYEAQCVTDTSYSFTAPYSPTDAQVAAMCASESCVNLFAYVSSMVTTDCRIPVGGKILLLADLVDYVSNQCTVETPVPTTAAPTTEPTATTPGPTTATPTPTTSTPVATCTTPVLTALLTDAYIDQCADDSGYSFTSGAQPTPEEVTGMCASSACANLLADVEAMGLSECILPIGDKIYLFRDLVDYVADQCSINTPEPTTANPEPTTAAPTPEPTATTPGPTTATPTPTTSTPVATCTTPVLTALLTDAYIDQCADDSGYSFTSGAQPTPEEVTGMCASSACANLLADVEAMGLSECILPIGDKIYLFRDLVDYVADQCSINTPEPTTANPEPTTAAPTPEPTATTPGPTTATPTPTTSTPVATCTTPVLTALLTDAYIDQCADDSGYSFTSGAQPTPEEVTGMCASSACANLLADVEAMGLSECILPIGDKIYLFRDLVDYVAGQCSGSTTMSPETPATTAPASESPITQSPGTESPSTPSPSSDSPATSTPGTESPITTTPSTESPTTSTPGTETPTTESPITETPSTETPEPTAPTHDAC